MIYILEDRPTELRHTKLFVLCSQSQHSTWLKVANNIPLLYRSCTRDICKISTFSNFQMFGWIKSKQFTCLIRGFAFYYIDKTNKIDKILPLSVQL
jgi:hypothetical protein